MTLEHSRGLRLAASTTGETESELARRMSQAAVVVSIDPEITGAVEAGLITLETLRRGPGRIGLDPARLRESEVARLRAEADAVAPHDPVIVGPGPEEAVRVHLGACAPDGVICVLPDAHGLRLVTDGRRLSQRRRPSALGHMSAASFAVAEAFKHVVRPRPDRAAFHCHLVFCPVTLGDDLRAAPLLPRRHVFDLGLIGNGAIGSAHGRILGGLDVPPGRALLVDPELYAAENNGTYSLGKWGDVERGTPKVAVVERALSGWATRKVLGTVEGAIAKTEAARLPWPRIVLSGLDSVAARRAAQSLWPIELIDAATGDTSVGLHHVSGLGPCLRCFFPLRDAVVSAAQALAAEFGLPIELAMRGGHVISEGDLVRLDDEPRERLRAHLGKPVCGLSSARRLTGEDDDYRPSVPFVSQQAACLGVGRLIASTCGLNDLPNFVQYDALIGPAAMIRQSREPRVDCYCQTRAPTIHAVRVARDLA